MTTFAERRHGPKVCILDEKDARALVEGGIAYACSSRRHQHCHKKLVEVMVKAGELSWLGKHKKIATYRDARTWVKTYRRNRAGEVATCGMQLVRG